MHMYAKCDAPTLMRNVLPSQPCLWGPKWLFHGVHLITETNIKEKNLNKSHLNLHGQQLREVTYSHWASYLLS